MIFATPIKNNRKAILEIASKYGALNVRVIGSFARDEADENSDIDFLVRMEAGRSIFDLGGLSMELEELLGRKVEVATDSGLKQRLREQVIREAVTL